MHGRQAHLWSARRYRCELVQTTWCLPGDVAALEVGPPVVCQKYSCNIRRPTCCLLGGMGAPACPWRCRPQSLPALHPDLPRSVQACAPASSSAVSSTVAACRASPRGDMRLFCKPVASRPMAGKYKPLLAVKKGCWCVRGKPLI